MRNHCVEIFITLCAVFLTFTIPASGFAGGSAEKINQYKVVSGVLTIKEGHGDFIVRTSDGKTQRFSVRADKEITRSGKPARYGDLQTSDRIEVKYAPSNREVIAIHASGS